MACLLGNILHIANSQCDDYSPSIFLLYTSAEQYAHEPQGIIRASMSTPTKIRRCHPPQTYVHLVRQLRNPTTATSYTTWDTGQNYEKRGIVGSRPRVLKRRTKLPRYTQPLLPVKEASMVEMFLQRNLGSLRTICGLSLLMSWFLLGFLIARMMNPY